MPYKLSFYKNGSKPWLGFLFSTLACKKLGSLYSVLISKQWNKLKKINKIWIVGANGQLGRAVFNLLDSRRIEILSTDIDDIDITNLSDTLSFSDFNHPDVIINCAAFTNIDEKERDKIIKTCFSIDMQARQKQHAE